MEERSAGEAGKTEMSAPESTRKGRLRLWQKRDSDPEAVGTALMEGRKPGVVTDPRPARFPKEGEDLVDGDE